MFVASILMMYVQSMIWPPMFRINSPIEQALGEKYPLSCGKIRVPSGGRMEVSLTFRPQVHRLSEKMVG